MSVRTRALAEELSTEDAPHDMGQLPVLLGIGRWFRPHRLSFSRLCIFSVLRTTPGLEAHEEGLALSNGWSEKHCIAGRSEARIVTFISQGLKRGNDCCPVEMIRFDGNFSTDVLGTHWLPVLTGILCGFLSERKPHRKSTTHDNVLYQA